MLGFFRLQQHILFTICYSIAYYTKAIAIYSSICKYKGFDHSLLKTNMARNERRSQLR